MQLLDLNGLWQLSALGEAQQLPATVPGTVAGALLAQGKIPDPYWRDNEVRVLPVFDKDYRFVRTFQVPEALLSHDRVLLRCDGLDTLAEITLNGAPVAKTDNMHVCWRFDVKSLLRPGENTLEVLFRSPVQYAKTHPSLGDGVFTFPTSLRKAACMFGWDWGLSLPDSGVWRDISLEGFDAVQLTALQVSQTHTDGAVTLSAEIQAEVWGDGVTLRTQLFSPEGDLLAAAEGPSVTFPVDAPRLWNPIGYGEQPLYTLRVTASRNGAELDRLEKRIGLRTVTLDRSPQPDGGYNYQFFVNGRPVYIMGQAMVIEDAFLARSTPARWKRLVDNAVRSHLNCIRVWGGAYYPPELFFDYCDEAGILVYMDFMFACSPYPGDDAFCESVKLEAEQNVTMMATHPSLLVLCGNNEILMLAMLTYTNDPRAVEERRKAHPDADPLFPQDFLDRLWADYHRVFRQLLPEVCSRLAPEIPYVHSSPCPADQAQLHDLQDAFLAGDMHYYLQYVGNLPYQTMEQLPARFLSEVGFEAYPSMKTINAFCLPEDQSPTTPVMLAHQKCRNGNETIEEYLSRDYVVPQAFPHYVYLSQLLQAEIMKFTSDVYRRRSHANRGTILWQYNDCWPVVSWSGVDYFGRWKALQYFIRRFFAPVIPTVKVEGDRVQLWACDQSPSPFTGELRWKLCTADGSALRQGWAAATLAPGESACAVELDFAPELAAAGRETLHLEVVLQNDAGVILGLETALFCPPKGHAFAPVTLRLAAREVPDGYAIDVTADRFAKAICLDTTEGDCLFSDNWFDLPAGETRTVIVRREDTDLPTLAKLRETLTALTLNDVMTQQR